MKKLNILALAMLLSSQVAYGSTMQIGPDLSGPPNQEHHNNSHDGDDHHDDTHDGTDNNYGGWPNGDHDGADNNYGGWPNGDHDGDHHPYPHHQVSTVPLPAAIWLFGAGVIGLIGFARRKS